MDTLLTRGGGYALCIAAVATPALNVLVSPHLPTGSFAVVAGSSVYFLRQCLAAVIAMLLVFGLNGIQAGRNGRAGTFGTIAFALALAGQVLLFAIEYGQAFMLHDYEMGAPAALDAGMTDMHRPLAIGALIAVATFYVGWLALAVSLLVQRRYSRLSAGLLLAGFVASPLLNAIKSLGVVGGIIGSLVIGAGWFLLGVQLIRQRAGDPIGA